MKDLIGSMHSETDELLKSTKPKTSAQLVFKYKHKLRLFKNDMALKDE